MKHPIAQSRNNVAVYVDLVRSQAAINIAQNPNLLTLTKELIEQLTIAAPVIHLEKDMGRTVGNTSLVETTDKDAILYARRLHDEAYTRFVKNGTLKPSNYLSITLERDDDGSYQLQDLWIGRLNPPKPGSDHETAGSKPFWLTHAFVFEGQAIQTRSITRVCPY